MDIYRIYSYIRYKCIYGYTVYMDISMSDFMFQLFHLLPEQKKNKNQKIHRHSHMTVI